MGVRYLPITFFVYYDVRSHLPLPVQCPPIGNHRVCFHLFQLHDIRMDANRYAYSVTQPVHSTASGAGSWPIFSPQELQAYSQNSCTLWSLRCFNQPFFPKNEFYSYPSCFVIFVASEVPRISRNHRKSIPANLIKNLISTATQPGSPASVPAVSAGDCRLWGASLKGLQRSIQDDVMMIVFYPMKIPLGCW